MSEDVISAEGLKKSYGPIEAVRGVDFKIGPGEIVGLLGPNGAGKTTILKMLTGYHYPGSGTAKILGHDVMESSGQAKSFIGYLPENSPVYPDLTVREYLEFIAVERSVPRNKRESAIAKAAAECGIEEVMERPISHLSKGFQQRVGIAQAVLHEPPVLILDEPTTGLDPNQIREIRNLIMRIGAEKSVVLSTHILQEVEAVCSRVLILNHGKVVAEGTTESIRRRMEGGPMYSIRLQRPAEGQLQGPAKEPQLRGTVKAHTNSPAEIVRASLEEDASVAAVIETHESAERLVAEVELTPGCEGDVLFRWACAQGYELIELTPKRISLEDVFENLTVGNDAENE